MGNIRSLPMNLSKSKYKVLLAFILTFLQYQEFVAQNLINDPSFEITRKAKSPQFRDLKYWYIPNNSSPDLYSRNCNSSYSTPQNFYGYQFPKDSISYVGIYLYHALSKNYREYIGTELNASLVANMKYEIKFYVSCADKFGYASTGLDVFLSSTKAGLSTKKLSTVRPYLTNLGGIITDTSNWIEVRDTFVAKGGEKFLVIGNSKTDNMTEKIIIKPLKNNYEKKYFGHAFIYIDYVSLNPINEKPVTVYNNQTKIHDERIIVLQNIYFDNDQSNLLPSSYNQLDSLVSVLIQNKSKIEVCGHTDNNGSFDYNLKLSEARAKAVADYIISKGIAVERVTYRGYGSTAPIDSNDSEIGQKKNRRVEFKIVE
jgi:OmpA-OmpF porin, OOP family